MNRSRFALIAGSFLATVAFAAQPASAADTMVYRGQIVNSADQTRWVLNYDGNGDTLVDTVRPGTYESYTSNKWILSVGEDGNVSIKNVKVDKCLTPDSVAPNSYVHVKQCDQNSGMQKWEIHGSQHNGYSLAAKNDPTLVLSVNQLNPPAWGYLVLKDQSAAHNMAESRFNLTG